MTMFCFMVKVVKFDYQNEVVELLCEWRKYLYLFLVSPSLRCSYSCFLTMGNEILLFTLIFSHIILFTFRSSTLHKLIMMDSWSCSLKNIKRHVNFWKLLWKTLWYLLLRWLPAFMLSWSKLYLLISLGDEP